MEAVLPVASSGELGVEEFTLGGVDTGWGGGGWWGLMGDVAAFPEVRGMGVSGGAPVLWWEGSGGGGGRGGGARVRDGGVASEGGGAEMKGRLVLLGKVWGMWGEAWLGGVTA